MTEWISNLLSAIGGVVVALLGRVLIEWFRQTRLEIDFEERAGQKPYTPDYNNETMKTAGDVHRIRYLRLKVCNKGKKPAMDCEAKLELNVEKGEINKVALHWSRRDPALYSEYTESGIISSTNIEVFFQIKFSVFTIQI